MPTKLAQFLVDHEDGIVWIVRVLLVIAVGALISHIIGGG